ncbi:unnamed protein product [Phytophthora fragariaefolia]|uniref:Unnamed protein product n=1 Tax=Phytophthora fragariaefolia TaxID=1490495 RepID=A0A9W6U8X8_9STRA|nr:unnamed protein product [Phytophthora fragariaefolia]
MLASDDLLLAAHVVSMRASIARLEEQTSQWRATSLENERLLQAARRAIAGHHQDREAIIPYRDSIARNRDSLMQDRDALAQDREVIVSDYLRLQEQYSNAYRRMWAIAAAMGQDVQLPGPSPFATYSPASSATAGRAHKSQRTDAASSAPRDVLDLRPRSPVRKNYPSGDSAQIDDSMPSASDDGNRDTTDVPAEIDRLPESSKWPDISPFSDSEPQEMKPEIAPQNVSDTTLPEIAGSDRREAVEEKEEAEDDGTDDEVLSALSRSRSSLRRRGSLTPRHRTLQPIIDIDGDGDSSSGSPSGSSVSERSGAGGVGPSPQDDVGDDPAVGDLAGATEADEIDDSPLFPTLVPRRLWIPGVCARLFRQPDVIPWDVYAVSSLRVSEIDVQTLSALLTRVSEWLFPAIDPASHPLPDSYEDLITGATVDALMDTSPWSKLSNGAALVTFIPAVSGRRPSPKFVQDYLILEERHLQSYWGPTHFLPISEAMCSADPALSKIAATTRSRQRRDWFCNCVALLQEPLVQRMRMERIGRAQDKEKWIVDLKKYLTGDVHELTSPEGKSCAKIAEDHETYEVGLLFYCPPSKQSCEDHDLVTRLVITETLQEDVLHHYHTNLGGGHQGESPGNLQATYPLQIIAMDHIPSLPKSYKGNTELLIRVDLFTDYVIAKASASRTAQTIAENYEECVFRRFGASEVIRHDREPGFMADFFRSFNKIADRSNAQQ